MAKADKKPSALTRAWTRAKTTWRWIGGLVALVVLILLASWAWASWGSQQGAKASNTPQSNVATTELSDRMDKMEKSIEAISKKLDTSPTVQTAAPVAAQPAQPMVNSGNTSPFPTLFNEQSTGKGAAFAYDIGVNAGQHGIVFGQFIQWSGQKSGDIQKGCGLVVLEPGFYRALYIVDGRYEIRDLPMGNEDFWRQKLAEDRAKEQGDNYGCSDKKAGDIPIWKSQNPSPPASVSQAAPATTPASQAPTTAPTVAPQNGGKSSAPSSLESSKPRVATGVGKSLDFQKGDAVIGFKIVLQNGKTCEGGGCYLPSAPSSGTVTDGVVNPWPSEIGNAKTWNP